MLPVDNLNLSPSELTAKYVQGQIANCDIGKLSQLFLQLCWSRYV
jgi:hypothetical protein